MLLTPTFAKFRYRVRNVVRSQRERILELTAELKTARDRLAAAEYFAKRIMALG